MRQCARDYGMVYLRFPRKGKQVYYEPGHSFTIGKGEVLLEGTDVSIIASGVEAPEALKAAALLAEEGISAEVIDMFTIKPVDAELICKSVRKTGCVVTAENHNIIGGLGSAVAEVIVEAQPVPMKRIGSRDCFGEVGSADFLREKFQMSAAHIAAAAKEVISRK